MNSSCSTRPLVEVNRLTTTANMHWRFLDRSTGIDTPLIDWQFNVGQRIKIRLINEWTPTTPSTIPSTCMAPASSWC
jgi:hypothetical protein